MNMPFLKNKTLPAIDFEKLLEAKDAEIEKLLTPLKFEEIYQLVLEAPWEVKAKLIVNSTYPEGLVKNLPPQELFLTMKASSLDIAVELLSYAKPSQIQFMFDIDCWYKDKLRSDRVASWIILLFQAGEDKVLEWLRIADWDFLIAIFKRFVKVYKKPDEVELVEAMDFLPPYTLDDFYFIEFKNEALEFYFKRMIEIMREEMPESYFALMESVMWELPLEVEERAYRWRNGRLADEGIPEYFEALDIYTPVHPRSLRKIEPELLALEGEVEPSINIMVYAKDEGLFIFKVLSSLKDEKQINRLKRELAWIANKVIVVDNVVIDEIEQVKKSLDKVWGALNIGLQYISMENLEVAKKAIETYFLEDIFRVSQTVLRELRKYAISLVTSKDFDPAILRYLDEPHAGYLKGILVKKLNQIKLFQPQKVGTDAEFTYFKDLKEVNTVRRYIEEVGYIAPIIDRAFGSVLGWIKEVNRPDTNMDVKFLTWSTLILTSLANWVLFKEFKFKAIPKSKWKELLLKLLEKRESSFKLKADIKEALFKNFKEFAKVYWYYEPELMDSFLNFVINRFEQEFKFVDPESPQDPKYQNLFLVDLSK